MLVYHVYAVPVEVRREYQISWVKSSRWMWEAYELWESKVDIQEEQSALLKVYPSFHI